MFRPIVDTDSQIPGGIREWNCFTKCCTAACLDSGNRLDRNSVVMPFSIPPNISVLSLLIHANNIQSVAFEVHGSHIDPKFIWSLTVMEIFFHFQYPSPGVSPFKFGEFYLGMGAPGWIFDAPRNINVFFVFGP